MSEKRKYNGICYGPYRNGQSPITKIYPSSKQIESDFLLLKKIIRKNGIVKTYSTLGTLKKIPQITKKMGFRCLSNYALDQSRWLTRKELYNTIGLAKNGSIDWLVVGDMSLTRKIVNFEKLVENISEIKNLLDIPVGASEHWRQWIKHPKLVDEVDFISIGIYPHEDGISISNTESYLKEVLKVIDRINRINKSVFIDSGWPSSGKRYKNSIFTLKNHEKYINKFADFCDKHKYNYLIFEAFDEEWKKLSEKEIGAHWGIFDKNREIKH